MHVLLAHASVHGSSAEIAEFMARHLRGRGFEATVAHVETITTIEPYDAVILGAPVHTGVWVKPMLFFLHYHQGQLAKKPKAAWLTCIRVLEPNGYDHVQMYYVLPDLKDLNLIAPIGIFAGKLNLQDVTPTERWLIDARYDGEPVMLHKTGDFRDWQAIGTWTRAVAEALALHQEQPLS